MDCWRCTVGLQERDRDASKAKAKEIFRWDVDSKRYAAANDSRRVAAVIVAQSLIRRFLVRCKWQVLVQIPTTLLRWQLSVMPSDHRNVTCVPAYFRTIFLDTP
jgi:hypothetical protein